MSPFLTLALCCETCNPETCAGVLAKDLWVINKTTARDWQKVSLSVWMGGEKKAGSLSKVKKCWFSLQSVSFWDISILETKSRVPWNPRHLQVKLKAWISSETREVFTPVPLVHIIYNMLCHYFVSIPLVSDHVHCMGIPACPSPSTRHNANGVTEPRSEWSQAM